MDFASRSLPDFPWDQLAPFGDIARAHADGIIDMSVGTPVDPTPEVIRAALASATDAPGYPTTIGSVEFRQAAINWLQRRLGISGIGLDGIIPTVGSKELVAWLPTLLGLTARDVIAIPATAYPTYDVGARIAGCKTVTADSIAELDEAHAKAEASGRRLAMVWLNSPSNPTGRVTSAGELAAIVQWAQSRDVIVVSDECYIELGWEKSPVSLLHLDVSGAQHHGLLLVNSLSKRSNLAGYRVGILAGDPQLIKPILEVRKHAGMILPAPIQQASVAAFNDDAHVDQQRARYAARRDIARAALLEAGFRIEHSDAGLYLWVTREEDCWTSVRWFAERGVLVAPGAFYGAAGQQFVRVALTVSDERVQQLPARLSS
jgi:succinyldiaminopimelate transaminase